MAESVANTTDEMKQIEKEEEAKLIAKYPSVARPGPAFLQKRLQKGVSKAEFSFTFSFNLIYLM